MSDQGGADEDSLIRQYREMQADQVASRVRRERVGSINRSDDGHDREYREHFSISFSAIQ